MRMDDLATIDTIAGILESMPEDHSCSPKGLIERGYVLTGALIVGQYVGPDGRSSAMVPTGIGNMNAWTQEGIHRWALRRLASGDYVTDEDDADE